MLNKKAIAVSFDNVMLDPGPLHTYCAFKAYKELAGRGVIKTEGNFRPYGIFGSFIKEVKPEDFVRESNLSKSFFVIAFQRLRHLARNEEEYLKLLVLIEKNRKESAVLGDAGSVLVYNAFKNAMLSSSGLLEQATLDQNAYSIFIMEFKEALKEVLTKRVELATRLYSPAPEIVEQMRKISERFLLYFVTPNEEKSVWPIIKLMQKVGCLREGDVENEKNRGVDLSSLSQLDALNWGELIPKKPLISRGNLLTATTFGNNLVEMLAYIAKMEKVSAQDVWYLTTKFKYEVAKSIYDAGFRRPNPLGYGLPLINLFIISMKDPFLGQYENEIGAGARILEYGKVAEQLIAHASI